MNRMYMALALVMVLGLVAAITPVESWDVISSSRYAGTVQANHTTQGGNVTNIDLSSNVSTQKWAGYWGDVSGRIILSPATYAVFYQWAWTPANGGAVCAVPAASGFDWGTVQSVVASAIDTVWGFGTATDNAANTLTSSSCSVDVAGTSVTNSAGNLTGVGGFETCAVADDAAPAAKSDFAFCVNVTSAGNLFNGGVGNYELLVPTDDAYGATETYYFWIEMQ